MSIQTQAEFYVRNVGDYDPAFKSAVALTEPLVNGFAQFSNLLRTVYQDWQAYETSTLPSERTKIGIMMDDLENYHNLTYTLECLFGLATVGALCSEGATQYLAVEKATFKTVYKKSVVLAFAMLETYGFYFAWYKGEKQVDEYKRCERFHVHYENGEDLIAAMSFIAGRLAGMERKKEMADKVAFMLADYTFILTGNINQDPVQQSIINTLGSVGELWKTLVLVIQGECGLVADSSFNPYVFPNRTVTFKRGKKTIIKCGINVEELSIRLPLSFEEAKSLIENRAALPPSIQQNIAGFGCVNCGKCQNKRNLEMVEGVPLCNLPYSNFVTEDSRCLCFELTGMDEVGLIIGVIRRAVA